MTERIVQLKSITFGAADLVLMAGPCLIEDLMATVTGAAPCWQKWVSVYGYPNSLALRPSDP